VASIWRCPIAWQRGIGCSWSAAGLTVVCLRKTVGDPAAWRVRWRWPRIRCWRCSESSSYRCSLSG
jgi:hypothetical protein